jgi:predicted dehydrogenase
MHDPAAKEFLRRGIHVICDKPLTSNLTDAKKLLKIAEESDALFVLTHNYTGYPMVRQARAMIASGELGEIRLVQAEYPQDWLAEPIEQTGQKQAAWRTDPKQSGAGGSTGDIGTHAYNLACFVTGLELDELAADVHTFVKGRQLDDNAHVMMRFKGGAKGMLWCSQVATGHENGLKLRVYGTKGGIEWVQADPNYLWFTELGKTRQLITRNGAGSGPDAGRVSRIPSGHPEGYLEGFATIYTEAAKAIIAKRNGKKVDKDVIYPTVQDGVKGVAFVEACIASSKRNGAWVKA